MRKLNILKAIVDYLWIMSLISFPLIIIIVGYCIATGKIVDIPIKLSGSTVNLDNNWSKVAILLALINFGLFLLGLYHFKKLLANFKIKQIFNDASVLLLNKIGSVLLYSSVICFFTEFFRNRSNSDNFEVQLGFGPFLCLIALGLFFKVLAEVFTMARKIKEENEFTV